MPATIELIAKYAGVSRGTVDRVLHNRGRVNQDVAARVWKIADELQYVPRNRKGRKDVSSVNDAMKLGVVTQLGKASFMLEIKRGIESARKKLEYMGIELLSREGVDVDEEEQLRFIDELAKEGIKGLAIMPVESAAVRAKLDYLAEDLGIPVVTFNSDIGGSERSCFVGLDNRKSGRVAAGLMGMLTRGSGKILIVTGYFSNNVNNMRVDGFLEEAHTAFPGLQTVGVQGSFDNDAEVERIIVSTMETYPDLTGILIVSGGQNGIGSAFESLSLVERPFVIAYDLTPKTVALLDKGYIDFLIDQNGYMQGNRALTILANMLRYGRMPDEEFVYMDISIKTKYNR